MSTVTADDEEPEHGRRAAGNGFVTDVRFILKRWLVKTIRNPFVVISSLFQPIIFLVLFTAIFGGVAGQAISQAAGTNTSYVTYLTPAIIIQSALVAAAGSGIGLVDDMENGMFEKVLVSPIHRGAMFLGKALSEVVRIIVQTLIILALGFVLVWLKNGGSFDSYVETGVIGVLGIIVVAIVFAIWFTAFSNLVGLLTRDTESTIIGANLLQFPLLFVSSAFLPVYKLPEWVQVLATYNPVTYGVDAARSLMYGRDMLTVIEFNAFSGIWNALVPALAILIVLDLVLGGITVHFLNRVSNSEVQ